MKIARPDGSVDWLFTEGDYGYDEFYSSVGTVIMGKKTYDKVLSFGDGYHYSDKMSYIFTRANELNNQNERIIFTNDDPASFARKLKNETKENIWLVGGGEITSILLTHNLIDEMQLFVHPVVLGEGIPLFINNINQINYKLTECKSWQNGLVKLKYEI